MGGGNSKQNQTTSGLRVIKISPDSPVSKTDLKIFTDFIVDIKNKPINFKLEHDFYKYIIENENAKIELLVYNILSQTTRVIKFKLTRDWPNSDFLLGFKSRYESIVNSEQNMYRVLSIINPNLFNQIKSNTYFFLAVNEFIFDHLDDLRTKLALYKKCEIVFFDLETEKIFLVGFNYDKRRGLGFEIGSGYLHDLCFIYKTKMQNRMNEKSYQLKENIKNRNEKKNLFNKKQENLFIDKNREMEMIERKKENLDNVENMIKNNIEDASFEIKDDVKVNEVSNLKKDTSETDFKIDELKVKESEKNVINQDRNDAKLIEEIKEVKVEDVKAEEKVEAVKAEEKVEDVKAEDNVRVEENLNKDVSVSDFKIEEVEQSEKSFINQDRNDGKLIEEIKEVKDEEENNLKT